MNKEIEIIAMYRQEPRNSSFYFKEMDLRIGQKGLYLGMGTSTSSSTGHPYLLYSICVNGFVYEVLKNKFKFIQQTQ